MGLQGKSKPERREIRREGDLNVKQGEKVKREEGGSQEKNGFFWIEKKTVRCRDTGKEVGEGRKVQRERLNLGGEKALAELRRGLEGGV